MTASLGAVTVTQRLEDCQICEKFDFQTDKKGDWSLCDLLLGTKLSLKIQFVVVAKSSLEIHPIIITH